NIPLKILLNRYQIQGVEVEYTSDKEIFPSQQVPVVLETEGIRKLVPLKWGFPNPYRKGLIINARGETVDSKPLFRQSFFEKRCIIPAQAFYEWKKEKEGSKKYIITREDGSPFSMAGLYRGFVDKEGNPFQAFVIITLPARGVVGEIHHRMPALLPSQVESLWLEEEIKDRDVLKEALTLSKGVEEDLKAASG
ncbi:MAG: SOS response-associated peptidase, partial [Candidatus Syntrophonatronum acetioxidans]